MVFELQKLFEELDWATSAEVRLREEGQVYFGEAFIVPKENTPNLMEKLEEARKAAYALHWRIFDLTVSPVPYIPEEQTEALKEIEEHRK